MSLLNLKKNSTIACLAWLVLAFGISCHSDQEKAIAPPFAAGEIARFEDLRITASELDALVLSLPAKSRPAPGLDVEEWYRKQIREKFMADLLEKKARQDKFYEDPVFILSRRETKRRLVVNQHMQELSEREPKITQEDVEKAYQDQKDQLKSPEKRMVSHIFRRAEGEEHRASAQKELDELRLKVLQGESFQKLAKTHSDSESRHREGNLGWISRGTLEPTADNAVFALEEGVPSEPVLTDAGVHLFYVDTINPVKALSLQEATPVLLERLRADRFNQLLDQASAKAVVPEGSIQLDREAFQKALMQSDQDPVLFRLADSEIQRSEFLKHIAIFSPGFAPKGGSEHVAVEKAWQAYELFRRYALIAHFCTEASLVDFAKIEKTLSHWEKAALVQGQRRKSLTELAQADEAQLLRFYESNIGQFSSVPAMALQVLRIPLGDDPVKTMATLENKAAQPGMTLDSINDRGGKLMDLGWKTIPELQILQPKLPILVSATATGQLTSPFRSGAFFEICQVMDRRPAEPIPFEKVKLKVAEAYAVTYSHLLYQQLLDTWVPLGKLEISETNLAQYLQNNLLNPDDISAEQLEELLLELEEE